MKPRPALLDRRRQRRKVRLEDSYNRGHFDGAQDNEFHCGRLDKRMYVLGIMHGRELRERLFNQLRVLK